MFILSIDVALKSLAICGITYDPKDEFYINDDQTYKSVKVLYNWTENLSGGQKVKELSSLTIIKLISSFIKQNVIPVLKTPTVILIEKQMPGTQTYISFITLLTLLQDYDIHIISPTGKNRLEIGGFTIVDGYKRSVNSYQANKEHSRLMFLYLKKFVSGEIIYNNKMETDIADAYTQLFYYLSSLST